MHIFLSTHIFCFPFWRLPRRIPKADACIVTKQKRSTISNLPVRVLVTIIIQAAWFLFQVSFPEGGANVDKTREVKAVIDYL
jgi:hypothetical protein